MFLCTEVFDDALRFTWIVSDVFFFEPIFGKNVLVRNAKNDDGVLQVRDVDLMLLVMPFLRYDFTQVEAVTNRFKNVVFFQDRRPNS